MKLSGISRKERMIPVKENDYSAQMFAPVKSVNWYFRVVLAMAVSFIRVVKYMQKI